jgi:enoyl-CoA hydratase/carnithine racemase
MATTLTLEIENRIATLTLNRPEATSPCAATCR